MSTLESTVITMESWMIMLVVAKVVMVVVMLMVGRGVDQTYGSQVCLGSAIVGTVQVVQRGVP